MPFDPDAPAAPDSGLFGLDTPPEEAAVWVQPVPFDATTSFRRGAAHGPAAVIAASHQVDLFDLRYGRRWRAGIHTAETPGDVLAWNAAASTAAAPVIQAGGASPGDPAVAEVDAAGARVNELLRARTEEALDAGVARIKGYVNKGLSRGKLTPKAAKAIEGALEPTDVHRDVLEPLL